MSIFGTKEPVAAMPVGIRLYPRIKAWSYSLVQQHDKCPLSVRLARIDRLPQPDNDAQHRGIEAHVHTAEYVKSGSWPASAFINTDWNVYLDTIRPFVPKTEMQFAFNENWEPRGWWDGDVWGRVIVDAFHVEQTLGKTTAVVHEWKTGKAWPEHVKQMRLYALAGFLLWPEADEVRVVIAYLDVSPKSRTARSIGVFQRSVLGELKQEFADFPKALLHDELYPARPNRFCGWCHYRKSNGGPCEHG